MPKKNEVVLNRPLEVIKGLPDSELSTAELQVKHMFLAEQMRQSDDDSSHVGRPQRIEVAHSVQMFKLPNGTAAGDIDVVILGSLITRAYYMSKDPNSPVYCDSIGGKVGRPSEHGLVLRKLDPRKTALCAECPFDANVFGSEEGRKGKKCKEMRKLLVFHTSNVKPMILSVPPTSIGKFDAYYDKVDSSGMVLSAMLTKIRLTPKGTFATFSFEPGPSIPPDQFLACIKLRDLYKETIRSVDASDYYTDAFQNEDRPPVNTEGDDLPF